VETRHMKALLTAQQISKTDRNDARGIAQMMRVGLFKPVHVKTLVAQEQRMLLTSRKLLQRKLLDVESDLRGTLRNFGLKVGVVSSFRYDAGARRRISETGCDRRAGAQCPPGPAPAVGRPAEDGAGYRPRRPGVSAADDRPRGRRSGSVDLPCDGRPATTFPPFPGGRCACRPDAEALPVRRDRL